MIFANNLDVALDINWPKLAASDHELWDEINVTWNSPLIDQAPSLDTKSSDHGIENDIFDAFD